MTYIIREAELQDAEAIARIHALSWEAAYNSILSATAIQEKSSQRLALWNRILQEDDTSLKVVAEIDGVIAGFMVLDETRDTDIKDKVLEIWSFYFLPEYWGKMKAISLLQYAIKHAKRKRYFGLSLWVMEENIRARKFYEKHGFFFDGKKKTETIGKEVTELRYWNTLVGKEAQWWRLL